MIISTKKKTDCLRCLNVSDASASTGLSQEQIRYYIKKGYLDAILYEGHYFIDRDALAEFYYYDVRGQLNLLSYPPETFEELSYLKLVERTGNGRT